ncbi:MAG: hypothetical protein KGI10_01105 [Thaumarchaeota archaeon]|nr:hypothetical protein [Nitrososphaerota archaeon]
MRTLSIVTIIGIASLVSVGIYMISNPIVHQTATDSLAVTNNSVPISSHYQTSGCGSPQFFNTLPALTPEEQQSAISLAEGSKVFQEKTVGMNYTVFTVAPNYSFDSKTCSNVSINAVTVGFKLGNGSSLGIYEDGNISKVTGANIPHISHGLQESSKS